MATLCMEVAIGWRRGQISHGDKSWQTALR
jgi:hypothetical protein